MGSDNSPIPVEDNSLVDKQLEHRLESSLSSKKNKAKTQKPTPEQTFLSYHIIHVILNLKSYK